MFWHFEHLTKSQASITEWRHAEASRLCRAVQVQTEPSVSFSSSYSSRFRLRVCQSGPRHSTPPIRSWSAFHEHFPNIIPLIFGWFWPTACDVKSWFWRKLENERAGGSAMAFSVVQHCLFWRTITVWQESRFLWLWNWACLYSEIAELRII